MDGVPPAAQVPEPTPTGHPLAAAVEDALNNSVLDTASVSSVSTSLATPYDNDGSDMASSESPSLPTRHLQSLRIDNNGISEHESRFDSPDTAGTQLESLDEKDVVSPLPRVPSGVTRKYHRHVSRSAAMRESVSQLPSIKDLKQKWSSGGQVEHRAGTGVGIRPSPLAVPREADELPRRERQPWKDVKLAKVALGEARKEASEIVEHVCQLWGIAHGDELPSRKESPESPADVAAVLVETARAVRRVRSLNMSVVPPGQRRVSAPLPRIQARFSTPSRPSSGPSQPMQRVASSSKPEVAALPDPSAPVRRAALDLLGQLRTLEERFRVQSQAHGAATEGGDAADSSLTGRRLSTTSYDDAEWSDDDEFNINEAAREVESARSHAPWEERLVSEGREYRDIEGDEWQKESTSARNAVSLWVNVVEGVFGEPQDRPTDPWVISDSGSDMGWLECSSELTTERVHAFLVAHLSPEHAQLLPPQSDKLLDRLSDGYLLVQAYNGSLGMSARPWGFIPPEDVHDTLEAEGEAGREWTFRRAGNLTCWAA